MIIDKSKLFWCAICLYKAFVKGWKFFFQKRLKRCGSLDFEKVQKLSWVKQAFKKKYNFFPKGGGGGQSQSLNYWYNFDKVRNFDLKTRTEWVCWCEAIQLLIFSIKRQENVVQIKTITKYSKQIKGHFGRKEKKLFISLIVYAFFKFLPPRVYRKKGE